MVLARELDVFEAVPLPGRVQREVGSAEVWAADDTDVTAAVSDQSVGLPRRRDGADAVRRNGRGDLAIVGREHLRDPYFALHAAQQLDRLEDVEVPRQYHRAF